MAKEILKNLPSGGAIVNDKGVTNDGSKGGVFVGKRHNEGGIQVQIEGGGAAEIEDAEPIIIPEAVNSTKKYTYKGKLKSAKEILNDINTEAGGVPIKKKGGELSKNKVKLPTQKNINVKPSSVIITRNAFLDPTKKDFNGKKLSNKEILSTINEDGGGVGFDDVDVKEKGGKLNVVPKEVFLQFFPKFWDGLSTSERINLLIGYGVSNKLHYDKYSYKKFYQLPNEIQDELYSFFAYRGYEISNEMSFEEKQNVINSLGKKEKGGEILLAPNGKPSNLTLEQYKLVRTPVFKKWFGDWISDPQNASKVVDENGEPLGCYHGSNHNFTMFNLSEIGSSSGNYGHYGYGFYFSDNIVEANGYGSKIYNCFINIKNPFIASKENYIKLKNLGFAGLGNLEIVGFDKDDLINKVSQINKPCAELLKNIISFGYEIGWQKTFEKYNYKDFDNIDLNDLCDTLNGYNDYSVDFLKSLGVNNVKTVMDFPYQQSLHWVTNLGDTSKYFTDTIKEIGYDGVVYGSEIVAFYPTQIKLADGKNTTFDINSNDIRYQSGGKLNQPIKAEMGIEIKNTKYLVCVFTDDNKVVSEILDYPITHKEVFEKYSKQGYIVKDAQIEQVENLDVIELYKKTLQDYILERYNEIIDWEVTFIPYEILDKKAIISTTFVTTENGNEYKIEPIDLFSNYKNGGNLDCGCNHTMEGGGKISDWDFEFTGGYSKGQKFSEQQIETIDVYDDNIYSLLFINGSGFDAKTSATIGLLSKTDNVVKLAVILGDNVRSDQKIIRRLQKLAEDSNRIIVENNSQLRSEKRMYPFLLVSKNDAKNYTIAEQFQGKLDTPKKAFAKTIVQDAIDSGSFLKQIKEGRDVNGVIEIIKKNGIKVPAEILNYSNHTMEKGGEINHEETYKKWKSLVNMSKSELENFYNTQEGKDAGLSSSEAKELGINSGRESARWILKMKDTPKEDWTPTMWYWANRQISFISRMKGNKGGLYDDKGNKTRKHTSLLIWGHNPEKFEGGGSITSNQMQEFERLKQQAMQELKGFETEQSEHNTTLENLEQHNISKDEAISEIVQEHLKENPNYYGKEKDCDCEHEELARGGSLINKRMKFPKYFKEQDGKYGVNRESENVEEKTDFDSSVKDNFTEQRQLLDEFFTPKYIGDIMYKIALKYGFKGGKCLEPSFGGGVFIDILLENGIKESDIWGFEIFEKSFKEGKLKYPKANLINHNFEYEFAKETKALNRDGIYLNDDFKSTDFDLVIGNPPYGSHKSPYSYLFDTSLQTRIEGFFIYLSLQKLKKGGLLVFIINSLWLYNGEKYNKQKQKIYELADMIDAYRLPNNIFKGENRDTSIATDIVVFRKR
jgi:hypothetical protein